jgi:glycogen(starch) synthase
VHIGFLTIESPFDPSRGGGIAAYLRGMVAGLIQAGHRVTVIAGAREAGTRHERSGVLRVVHIHLPALHWYLAKMRFGVEPFVLPLRQVEWSLKFYAVARRVFAEDPVDVLESSETGALLLAYSGTAPLIVRLHGSDYIFRKHMGESLRRGSRWNHCLEQAVWKRARRLTSPSRFQAKEVLREMGWKPNRIDVIPNPIAPELQTEAMQRAGAAEEHGGEATILYTGRLAPVKGVRPLLQALEEVQRTECHTRCVLAGPWQMREKPEHLGLEKTGRLEGVGISWLGHVPWHKLNEWYRQATVFIMPSYYETFGISVVEAMAFGLPVVATAAGGLSEVVEDGVTGILVPPGDSHAMAQAILSLLRDPDLRRRMGQAGRERVLTEFTVERVVQRTVAVYQEAVRQ